MGAAEQAMFGRLRRRNDMDLTKFTERARGFIQSAQTIALRENHQRLELFTFLNHFWTTQRLHQI